MADSGEILAAGLHGTQHPTSVQQALKILSDEQLGPQAKQGAQSAIDKMGVEFLANNGVSCFSEKNDNLRMWAHYGGHCRGFCLEFSTTFEPFNKLQKVRYKRVMPQLQVSDVLCGEADLISDLICIKSEEWSYEQEWRAIHHEAGTAFTYEANALVGIYFGPKIQEDDTDMVCLIMAGQNPAVRFYHGQMSSSDFKVEFREFKYTTQTEARRQGLL